MDGLVRLAWSHRRPSRIRLYPRDWEALQHEGLTLSDVLPAAEWEAHRHFFGNIHDELPRNASGALVLAAVEPTLDRLTARYVRRAIGSDRERTVKLVSLGEVRDLEARSPDPISEPPDYELWIAEALACVSRAERELAAAVLAAPRLPLAAIGVELGIAPATARKRFQRLLARLAS